jgi:hypothetical protein
MRWGAIYREMSMIFLLHSHYEDEDELRNGF